MKAAVISGRPLVFRLSFDRVLSTEAKPVSVWLRTVGRKALEPGRADLALAILSWLAVFGLICAVIADSFR